MIIDAPCCDWIAMPFKDKRKGYFWLCQSCGAKAKGKQQPLCGCRSIEVRL